LRGQPDPECPAQQLRFDGGAKAICSRRMPALQVEPDGVNFSSESVSTMMAWQVAQRCSYVVPTR